MCIWGYKNGISSKFWKISFVIYHFIYISIILLLKSLIYIYLLLSGVSINCYWLLLHCYITIIIIVNLFRFCYCNWLYFTIIVRRSSFFIVNCFLILKFINYTLQIVVDQSYKTLINVGLKMSLAKYVKKNILYSFINQE